MTNRETGGGWNTFERNDFSDSQTIEPVFSLTKDLNHTNICLLYGMKSDPGIGWFYVMGYADGGTLLPPRTLRPPVQFLS